MSQQDMDQDWEITVTVPLSLPAEQREALFSAVADTVAEWEPEDRTDWDAMVSAHPETFSLLLWLHAEKVWQLERVEASRRDWAAEALGLLEKLERLENLALNTAALHSGMLVGIAGEHDPVPSDEQCQRAASLIERAIRRGMGPGYVTQAELRLLTAIGPSQDLCACLTPEGATRVAADPRWSLPLCAVHPEVDR